MDGITFSDILYGVLAGIVVLILEIPITHIIDKITEGTKVIRPSGFNSKQWEQLVGYSDDNGKNGSILIGRLERILFFVSLLLNFPQLILAWFAFKVASKWETWNNLIKVPQSLRGVKPQEYLVSRNRWGTKTYQRLLIGMLLNLLSAFIGIGAFFLLKELDPLQCILLTI